MKQKFTVYIESEQGEVEIGCIAYIDAWPSELGDRDYPGCDAGSSITDIEITEFPDPQSIRDIINVHGGANEQSVIIEQDGISLVFDRYKGVAIDMFHEDSLVDYLQKHYL